MYACRDKAPQYYREWHLCAIACQLTYSTARQAAELNSPEDADLQLLLNDPSVILHEVFQVRYILLLLLDSYSRAVIVTGVTPGHVIASYDCAGEGFSEEGVAAGTHALATAVLDQGAVSEDATLMRAAAQMYACAACIGTDTAATQLMQAVCRDMAQTPLPAR